METSLSSKGMILDLCSQRQRLLKVKNYTDKFDKLVDCLTEKDYYYDDDLPSPRMQDFAMITGFTMTKFRKQLQRLYEFINRSEEFRNEPCLVDGYEVSYYIKGYRNSKLLKIKGSQYIPRVGESIEIPYFKEYLGATYYHVYNIITSFEDGVQNIEVSLKPGKYNHYWRIRLDQAETTREISITESFKENYEIQDLLNISPGNAW